MRITFRELFKKLDAGEKINGLLSVNGQEINVRYYENDGWMLFVNDKVLCMNMSSKALDLELDYYENLAIGFSRYYNNGELPLLAFDSMADAGCITGFGGTSMSFAPLYVKGGRK